MPEQCRLAVSHAVQAHSSNSQHMVLTEPPDSHDKDLKEAGGVLSVLGDSPVFLGDLDHLRLLA